MSKVIMIADVHMGYPNRNDDVLWSLEMVDHYARAHNIDTIVILGDLFDNREALRIDSLTNIYQFFERSSDLQWIAFPGNHDLYYKHSWKIHSLIPLNRLITVIDTVKPIALDDVRFWILPFVFYESAYLQIVEEIAEYYEDGDCLLTHIGVNNAIKNVCFLLKEWKAISFVDTPFDLIYTGHFHVFQRIGNLTYPGSLIPFKFDEGDCEHGFIVFDTETRTDEFVDIFEYGRTIDPSRLPPKFMTVMDTDIQNLTDEEKTGNKIRIAPSHDYSEMEKDKLKKELKDAGAIATTFMAPQADEVKLEHATGTGAFAPEEIFERWIEQDEKGTKHLDKPLLRKINRQIVLEGDEIYNARNDNDN